LANATENGVDNTMEHEPTAFHRAIDRTPLSQVESRRGSIMQSPYMFKELPGAVHHLQAFIRDVRVMLREDVPALIVEVKQLRQENKRLEARLDALENSPVAPSADSTDA
jgi:hypothetical protein